MFNQQSPLNGDIYLILLFCFNFLPYRETAISETEHLLSTCDDNLDGKLFIDEIVDHHDIFVGSEATSFGDHLHKINPRDEL